MVIAAGTTRTARIERITAAGADPKARAHVPSVDAELVRYGRPVSVPRVPTSPSGTPTPALVTRAVLDAVSDTTRDTADERATEGVTPLIVDAGMEARTAAPTIDVAAEPGGDLRTAEPVPAAHTIADRARAVGRGLPTERLVIGETVPAGTTTALGVLAALGEPETVSSSLPNNPLARKREVVTEGLAASDLDRGDCAGEPMEAVGLMGDPTLAAVFGLAAGALSAGRRVTLGGGTQMATVAALLAHAGREPPPVATTSFVAADESAEIRTLTDAVSVDLRVTDPGFDAGPEHPATAGYLAGEAKEGVGMGGALALAADAGLSSAAIRAAVIETYDRLIEREPP